MWKSDRHVARRIKRRRGLSRFRGQEAQLSAPQCRKGTTEGKVPKHKCVEYQFPSVTPIRARSNAKNEEHRNEPQEQPKKPEETPNKRRSRKKERGEGVGVGVHSP